MAGEQDGHQYLVCDWTEGISLRHHALQSKPSPAEVARLIEELCRILDYAHRQGVVHHDLRPENVLLTTDGLKVLNIGLPRSPDETADPSQSQLLNILRYKAPEQMDDEPLPITVAVNVYTLGTFLYEMLTAASVFPMRSLFSAIDQLRNQQPLPPSQLQPLLPAGLDAVCLKCLEKSPARRYPTTAALADEMRRFRV
jgi:serine/threonine-protein kinase